MTSITLQDEVRDKHSRWLPQVRRWMVAAIEGKPSPDLHSQTPPVPVFVTVERHGRVLGCRGSLQIRSDRLERELELAARSAVRHDPRYPPIQRQELDQARITITFVERLLPVRDVKRLTTETGLVLRSGNRVGVVLPFEGRDPETRLKWAYQKAGIQFGSSVSLFAMHATRVSE